MLKRIVPLVLALVLCAGLAQAKTKAPATQLPGDLTLAEAQKVLDAALVKAKAQGVPMNIAIVDAGGNLKAFVRQDGAFIGSIDVSTKKAVTARYFNMPTSTLGAASQPGQELFGIEATNGGLVIFGGGELLIRDNVIVGAIGVSGGSVAEDTNVAKAGAAALLEDFRAVAAAGLRQSPHAPVQGVAAQRALRLAEAAIQRLGAQVNPKIVLSVFAAKLA